MLQEFRRNQWCFRGADTAKVSEMCGGLAVKWDGERRDIAFLMGQAGNHSHAQYYLGVMYLNGYIVARDRKRGEALLRQAATDLGAASFVLGRIKLMEGKTEEAKELFNQGSTVSMRSSDALYKFGRMTADVAIVMQAADLENARALRRMSTFYRDLEDSVMEKQLAKRAANQGLRSALRTLGEIYLREGKREKGEWLLKRSGPRGREHAGDLF